MSAARVAVVGAGVAGAACAAALTSAGVRAELFERGRTHGGRMASPELHGRRTDLGAAYLTARDARFGALVEYWTVQGLARPWTDTVSVISPDGHERKPGPVRHAAPGGLRSLVRDLLPEGVRTGREITSLDELDHDAVVLAMPDPQAARLLDGTSTGVEWVDYEPVVAVAAGWRERGWGDLDVAFVNDDPDISLIADDGARRGDGAPVLVIHTTGERARQHLDDPQSAVDPVLSGLTRLLGLDEQPEWTHAHRWSFAKPTGTHGEAPFGFVEHAGRPLGLCTDSWCPSGSPRVEAAWLSGHRLGRALASDIGSPRE